MLCVVVLLRLQLNFWISFKGESVVDLIIYCGAVVASEANHVEWAVVDPILYSLSLSTACPLHPFIAQQYVENCKFNHISYLIANETRFALIDRWIC